MDSNPTDSTVNPPSLSDPNLVNTLVEELKSKGIFDQIRGDALAEVDTKVNLFVALVGMPHVTMCNFEFRCPFFSTFVRSNFVYFLILFL